MLTLFALFRIPLIFLLFASALALSRRKIAPAAALGKLWLPLLGLLITSAGDWAMGKGNFVCGTFFFALSHLCWFVYLVRRGGFSWMAAGLLTLLLVPFLAALICPAMPNAKECAVWGYAFCTVLSLAAAFGSRDLPAGKLYLGGIVMLFVSDLFLSLRLAGFMDKGAPFMPFYFASLLLIMAALIGSIPHCLERKPPETDSAEPPLARQCCNAKNMQWLGAVLPLFFLAAMVCYKGSYSWYEHYISESGLVFLEGRLPNRLSAWLLTSGLTLSALVCGWYFAERFRWGKAPLWQRSVILFFALLGSAGLVGIGALPFDQHPDLHDFCTLCTVPFGIAIFFSALTPDDQFGTRSEKSIWLTFITFILAAVLSLIWLKGHEPVGLPRTPTGQFVQKMTVLAFYVYMMGQVALYRRNTAKTEEEKKELLSSGPSGGKA